MSSKPKKNTYHFEFLKKSNTATHITIKVIEDSAVKMPFPVEIIQLCFSDIILEIAVKDL